MIVALVLVIGLVWLAGGFEQRTDQRTVVTAGTTITTGPYELTFDRVTVQKTTTYSDEVVWEVVVAGSGRVTGEEALAPSSLDWFFAARDVTSDTVEEPDSQQFGPAGRDAGGGSFFTPGLAPIPYRLVFQFPGTLAQPREVQLGVWDLAYRDTTLLKTGERSWARADSYHRYDGLPVRRLPDDLD